MSDVWRATIARRWTLTTLYTSQHNGTSASPQYSTLGFSSMFGHSSLAMHVPRGDVPRKMSGHVFQDCKQRTARCERCGNEIGRLG